jgi:hypothetical protein
MIRADPLSRRPDHGEGVDLDNSEQMLLKPEFFAIRTITSSHESPVDNTELISRIKNALTKDKVTANYKGLLSAGT